MTAQISPALPKTSILLSAIQQTGVAFVFCGADRRIEWVNDAFTDVTGYEPHEVIGKLTRELSLAAPLLGTVIDGNLMKLIEDGEVRFEAEIIHKMGYVVTCDIWFREIKDADGDVQGFLISAIDISELIRTKKRLSSLMDNAVTGIVVHNHEGIVSDANPEALRLLGLTLEQMSEQSLVDPTWRCIHENGSDYPYAEYPAMRALETGEPVKGDVMGVKYPNGNMRWLQVNSSAFANEIDGRRNVVSSFVNISAAKEKEKQLIVATEEKEDARRRAEQATRSKSEFLATMSHEIRTPLNGVMGMLQLLARTKLDGTQGELIDTAYESADSLLRLLNDILDYSKIESGRIDLETRGFDPVLELSKVIGLMEPRIDEKALELSVSMPEKKIAFFGDSGRFGQVALNLLGNAIKFTQEGSVKISLSYDLAQTPPALRVEITDTGIGVPDASKPSLFTRFTQADSSISRKFQGTGLGLAICKEIIDLMDGDIGFVSDEGDGSTFWFEITSKSEQTSLPEENVTPLVTLPDVQNLSHPGKLNILLAEDHPVNQRIVRTAVEALGHRIDVVGNGKEAVQAIRKKDYDLAFIDIHMPVLDGQMTTRIIRGLDDKVSKIPLYAMTADVLPENMAKYIRAGFDGIIEKPVKLDELALTLETIASGLPPRTGEVQSA